MCSSDLRIEIEEPHILVNGISVPEPLRVAPMQEAYFCLATVSNARGFHEGLLWLDLDYQRMWLRHGLIHLTREAAEAHGKAMRAASEVKS